jgi:hypothetical protein
LSTAKRIAGLGLVFVALTFLLYVFSALFGDMSMLVQLVKEDSVLETIGVLSLFAAAAMFIVAYVRSGRAPHRAYHTRLRRLVYIALVVLLLFGAGEEISWGQRLFHIETPEALGEVNVQDELNVHNLMLFGIDFGGWMRRLFTLFWFGFVLFVPLIAAFSERARALFDRVMPVVPWPLGLPMVLNYVALRAVPIFSPESLIHYHYTTVEIYEMNSEVLLLIVAAFVALYMLRPRGVPDDLPEPAPV